MDMNIKGRTIEKDHYGRADSFHTIITLWDINKDAQIELAGGMLSVLTVYYIDRLTEFKSQCWETRPYVKGEKQPF